MKTLCTTAGTILGIFTAIDVLPGGVTLQCDNVRMQIAAIEGGYQVINSTPPTDYPPRRYAWIAGAWALQPGTPADVDRERLEAIDATIAADNVLAQIKAMTNAEYNAYWAANVVTAADAIGVLKRVVRVMARRSL